MLLAKTALLARTNAVYYLGAVVLVFCLYTAVFSLVMRYADSHGMPVTVSTGSIDNPDTGEYLILGHTLLETGQFLNGDGVTPASFRTPGYPFFIAILVGIFGSDMAIQFAQFILVGISAVCIYLLGLRFWSKWIGCVAAILYVCNPLVVLYSFATMAETLFNTIFFGALVVLTSDRASRWHFFAGGLLLGVATLVRPMGMYLLPVFFIWIALQHWKDWRKAAQYALIMSLGVLLLVAPWMMRNQVQFGHAALSTIGPYDMLIYNIPEFIYHSKGIPADETRSKVYETFGLTPTVSDDLLLRSWPYMGAVGKLAITSLSDAPVRYGIYHLASTVAFFFGSDIGATQSLLATQGLYVSTSASVNHSYLLFHGEWREFFRTMIDELPELVERLMWLTLFGMSFVVAFSMLIRRSSAAPLAVLYLFLILSVGVLIGPVSEPRFRMTVSPFLFILGFTGLTVALRYVKDRFYTRRRA